VPLDHDDVAQSTAATLAVGVASAVPKLRPVTVAVTPPDRGMFGLICKVWLTAGASKVNGLRAVATSEDATVRVNSASSSEAAAVRQVTVVVDAHDDVAQSTDDTVTVGVGLAAPKVRPVSVAVAPPDVGRFATRTPVTLAKRRW
jgi:hypothetical protein